MRILSIIILFYFQVIASASLNVNRPVTIVFNFFNSDPDSSDAKPMYFSENIPLDISIYASSVRFANYVRKKNPHQEVIYIESNTRDSLNEDIHKVAKYLRENNKMINNIVINTHGGYVVKDMYGFFKDMFGFSHNASEFIFCLGKCDAKDELIQIDDESVFKEFEGLYSENPNIFILSCYGYAQDDSGKSPYQYFDTRITDDFLNERTNFFAKLFHVKSANFIGARGYGGIDQFNYVAKGTEIISLKDSLIELGVYDEVKNKIVKILEDFKNNNKKYIKCKFDSEISRHVCADTSKDPLDAMAEIEIEMESMKNDQDGQCYQFVQYLDNKVSHKEVYGINNLLNKYLFNKKDSNLIQNKCPRLFHNPAGDYYY